MGLNCGCPLGNSLPDLELPECKESMGQLQRVLFQRIYKSTGEKNKIELSTAADGKYTVAKSKITPFLVATDSTKVLVSPYIQNPTTEPGAARTFGGGNQTLGGIEIVIGREPTTFSGIIYQESQSVIKVLKELSCENIGVYLIDENGRLAGSLVSATSGSSTTYSIEPLPIDKFFVGDKKLGGFEEPDSNTIEWSFFPNWSDNLAIVSGSDFNPLTDLVNWEASA